VAVAPFDAYASDLCPAGRCRIEFAEIWLEPDLQRLHVRVHNVGNQAVYNLPVVVTVARATAAKSSGPFGRGTGPSADVSAWPTRPRSHRAAARPKWCRAGRPLEAGDSVEVAVNPEDWPDGLAEDSFDNNHVRSVTLSPDQSRCSCPKARSGRPVRRGGNRLRFCHQPGRRRDRPFRGHSRQGP